jgi:hypothetical protein
MAMTICFEEKIIWSNLLYRLKYRPQTFNDVVGLLPRFVNAIGSLALLYYFEGLRGVEKQLVCVFLLENQLPVAVLKTHNLL